MPVAVRRKSWEEHVTHRTGLRYSFDDLDILCCHGIAQDGCQLALDVSKPGRRGRCASLPECCRELRAGRLPFTEAQVNAEDADANITLPEPSNVTPKEGSTETLVFVPDENSTDGTSDSSSTEPDRIGPLETGASGKYLPSTETPGEGADVGDCGPEDGSETSDQAARSKHEEGPTQAIGSPKNSSDEAATPPAFVDSRQEGSAERLDPSPCKAADARATGTLGNISGDDAIPIEAGRHPEASPSRRAQLSPRTVEAKLKTAVEQCTNAISEGETISGRPLSGARQVLECNGANSDIVTIREGPESDKTDSRETDFDKSTFTVDLVHEVPCNEGVGCQNYQENQRKPLGESTNATSNMDLISEVPQTGRSSTEAGETQIEAKLYAHKEEESIVKLRKRKGSKEERERSHLDSMILLIMKLDQLDQDIENALSATSSISNTPTLKRRNGKDPEGINGGDAFQPTHQQKTVPHMTCSALTSPGSTTSPGEKARTGTMPSISENDRAEIEAKEACDWLRAAGFPQYAQLYEDSQFPIEIPSVTRDHDFLDRDAIEALCRRLNTLNKCAVMRLEITPQRKQSEDSDEDEPCAISGRWTFQRDSKRWSRLEELDVFSLPEAPGSPAAAVEGSGAGLKVGVSAESVLSDLSEQPEVGSLHSLGSSTGSQGTAPAAGARADSVTSVCSSGNSGSNEDRFPSAPPSPRAPSVLAVNGKPGGKSTRSKAKSFLKRMESLRLKGSPSKKKKVTSKLMIGAPVLQEGGDQEEKLRRLNCVEISSLNGPDGPRGRSVSYSAHTSTSSSSSSSQSEAGSSAVSTPSPVTRARSRSTACANNSKRGGMYLEGFDPFSHLLLQPSLEEEPPGAGAGRAEGDRVAEQNRRNRKQVPTLVEDEEEEDEEEEEVIFFIPEGHKPGTFPKALHNGSPHLRLRRESSDDSSKGSTRRNSLGSLDSRLSFYDNVPSTLLLPGRGDEPGADDADGPAPCPKLDDILQHVRGLQRFVNEWSEHACEEEGGDSDSALDSASPCPSSPLRNHAEENGSDLDSVGNSVGEQDETATAAAAAARERRDSGVGASLTRSNRPQKLRWHSFQSSHRPSLSSALLQISCQSVLQMNLLQKFSLLKLTALLEKSTPTNKHGFSWAVPKFMKRIKVRDYKDRSVFGVPLQVNVQRSGQPLPQGIQQAMRYLRNQCLDQVGLFRKSGVKSRIQALRQMNETCAEGVGYEGQSAYDVADMLKQYFRDLPEPLLTSKLSETFLQIYQYVPKDQRLQAIKAATLLLPDDNREALQTLLYFLSDVAANVAENQMTSTNLAVCLAPSLFHLNTLKRENSSPRVMHRKHSLGKPDQKDLNENLAATHGLAHMIAECKKLFQIPEEMSRCRNSYMEHGLHPPKMEDLGEAGPEQHSGYRRFLKEGLESLLKEAKEKFKGYDSYSTPEQTELACKKVHDGYPLRVWKAAVEVPAGPEEVLTRVLRERHRWDEDLLEAKVVEDLGGQTEVYQYVQNSMAPHPTRDHVVLRTWATDLPKGACAIFGRSVDHDGAAQMGVRVNVLTSRYFIEPCGSGKSRLTYICRTDCRGRFPEWYNKMFGHTCGAEVVRIRDSFTSQPEK